MKMRDGRTAQRLASLAFADRGTPPNPQESEEPATSDELFMSATLAMQLMELDTSDFSALIRNHTEPAPNV